MTPEEQRLAEENKLLHATLQQLVTLSSGFIVAMTALWEKLSRTTLQAWAIVLPFVGFSVCIVAGLFLMRSLSLDLTTLDAKKLPGKEHRKYKIAKWCFLLAVPLLVAVVLLNLIERETVNHRPPLPAQHQGTLRPSPENRTIRSG